MKQKVAFFDIDGTVFRSSLFIELVKALIEEGIFPREAENMYTISHTAWLNREGSYDVYIEDVVASYMKHIRGVHYGDFADVGKRVVQEQSKRVYRYTRDLIIDLKGKGYFIVAISQSPKTVLDEFCKSYGFDKVYGRMYEIGPQDRFTGKIIDKELIQHKAHIIERLLEKESITLEDSIGVGDSEGDISLLEMVDTPICFNPNKILYEYAQLKKWTVVVERKDVVYTI